MLDWEYRGREFKIKQGQTETIKVEDAYKALNVEENVFTDKDVFIRDRFDRGFFFGRPASVCGEGESCTIRERCPAWRLNALGLILSSTSLKPKFYFILYLLYDDMIT
jgi:hypothetical protein